MFGLNTYRFINRVMQLFLEWKEVVSRNSLSSPVKLLKLVGLILSAPTFLFVWINRGKQQGEGNLSDIFHLLLKDGPTVKRQWGKQGCEKRETKLSRVWETNRSWAWILLSSWCGHDLEGCVLVCDIAHTALFHPVFTVPPHHSPEFSISSLTSCKSQRNLDGP